MGGMSRVPTLLLSVATALATALGLAAATPSSATAHEAAGASVRVGEAAPATEVRFQGRGYGHGKGLSQYGARDRANAGHTHRQILGFYYPNTRWDEIGGNVRVLITGDTSRDVTVLAQRNLSITALRSGRTWTPRIEDVRRWRIDSDASGDRSVLSYLTGSWHRWRDFAGDAQFSGGGPITLVTPAGKVSYRGALRSAAPGTGRDRDTVNVVSLENYLRGVVPREVPALWPGAAVRAQSVAARTYAAFERAAAPGGRHYQICDTAHCQVYGGHSAEHPASNQAIAATRERVLTHDGEPAFTQFSASNGGWTVKGGFPYLPAKQDTFDRYPWTATRTADEVDRHWPAIGELESIQVVARDGHGQWNGRVLSIRVTDDQGSTTVDGSTFASRLGLRSTWFDVEVVS